MFGKDTRPCMCTHTKYYAIFKQSVAELVIYKYEDSQFGPAATPAPGFKITAHTEVCPVAAAENVEQNLYCVQFHPEAFVVNGNDTLLPIFTHFITTAWNHGCAPNMQFRSRLCLALLRILSDNNPLSGRCSNAPDASI